MEKKHEEAAAKAAELERIKKMTSLDLSDLKRFKSTDNEQPSADPVRSAFDMMDADGSGTLDRSEVRQLCKNLGRKLSNKELDQLIDKMDSDKSGAIDFKEFSAYYSMPVETQASTEQGARPRQKTDWAAQIAKEEEAAKVLEPEPEPEQAPAPVRSSTRRRLGRMGTSGMRASRSLNID